MVALIEKNLEWKSNVEEGTAPLVHISLMPKAIAQPTLGATRWKLEAEVAEFASVCGFGFEKEMHMALYLEFSLTFLRSSEHAREVTPRVSKLGHFDWKDFTVYIYTALARSKPGFLSLSNLARKTRLLGTSLRTRFASANNM